MLNEHTHPEPQARRILVAEDNPQDLFLLCEAFVTEKLEVEIDCVTDGDQLLTKLVGLSEGQGESYGLVLLDYHLPRRSAEEVLMTLNEQQRTLGVPLVVLTTMISEGDKRRLLKLGVKDVLAKPFDLAEYFALARTLSSLLLP